MKHKPLIICALISLITYLLMLCPVVTVDASICDNEVLLLENSDEAPISVHLEYIRRELKRYGESELYFDKYGISVKLRDYINSNDIDTTSPEVAELILINEAHIAELLANEDEYDLLLLENAKAFVEICSELKMLEDYTSIRNAYVDAYYYFFNMDVSYNGVQDAIKVYEGKIDQMQLMEHEGYEFIASVDELVFASAVGEGNIIDLILKAHDEFLDADPGVAGVERALSDFNRIKSEYNESVAVFNEEIADTRLVASSFRSHAGTEGFLAFILEIIG